MNVLSPINSIHKNSLQHLNTIPSINWTSFTTEDSDLNQPIYAVVNETDLANKPHYRKWKDTAYVDQFKEIGRAHV